MVFMFGTIMTILKKPISSNQYADLSQERLIGGMNT